MKRSHDAPALPHVRRQGKQHPRVRVKETGCGVVWLCTLRVGCAKGGGMKRIVLLLAAMLCLPQGAAAQSQIGQDIDGEAAEDLSGKSVSLSEVAPVW